MMFDLKSGFSAQSKRWHYPISMIALALLFVVAAAPAASAAVVHVNPMVQCIPFLDVLTDPLRPLIRLIGGGLAGFIVPIAAIAITAAILFGVYKAWKGERISALAGIIFGIVGVVLMGAAALILLSAVIDTAYSSCSRSLIG